MLFINLLTMQLLLDMLSLKNQTIDLSQYDPKETNPFSDIPFNNRNEIYKIFKLREIQ